MQATKQAKADPGSDSLKDNSQTIKIEFYSGEGECIAFIQIVQNLTRPSPDKAAFQEAVTISQRYSPATAGWQQRFSVSSNGTFTRRESEPPLSPQSSNPSSRPT